MSQFQPGVVIQNAELGEFDHIDFEEIEAVTGFACSEEMRRDARHQLSMYEFELKSTKNVPAQDVERKLKRVVTACEVLEPILRSCTGGHEESGDLFLLQSVRTWSSPKSIWANKGKDVGHLSSDFEVAEYLHQWKIFAEEALQREGPGKGRRRHNQALMNLLHFLHHIFHEAGGKGRGCYPSSYSEDGYKGPFLDFAFMLLAYTSQKKERAQLAKYIIKNYKLDE
jgi:hypothetical protein